MEESRTTKIVGFATGVMLVAVLLLGYFGFIKPRMELKEAAQNACDQLDGAIVLQVGPIVSAATKKAERAGFSGPELGAKMRELCPDTMRALDRWASEN